MRPLILMLLLVSTPLLATDQRLVNTDIFELELVAETQISPDGSQVVYVRRAMDIMTDQAVSNLWIVDADGSNHRALLSGPDNYGSPRWSPDGTRLAYVTSVDGRGAQIHLRWMDNGHSAVLSNLRRAPASMSWSPDGQSIAFTMLVPETPASLVTPPKAPEGAEWAPPVKVIDRVTWRADGQGELETGFSQVFVISAEGGTPRQLTSGAFNHNGPIAWSPDSETIYFSANRNADWQLDRAESAIWALQLSNKALTKLTDIDGPENSPAVSPDGSKLAFLGFEDKLMGYQTSEVSVLDLEDGSIKVLTADFDRSVDEVQWAGSSNRLYVQYDDHGKTYLASLTTGGTLKTLADDLGGTTLGRPYTSGSFSASQNGAYAYTAGQPLRPAGLATGKGNAAPKRIVDLNEDLLGYRTMGAVQEVNWASSYDGQEIQGWIVTPPDFDPTRQYPLILEIHGGPFAAYGPQFSAEAQLFAAAGYVVLYSNPRGSTSYGYGFANEIHHNYPGQDYDDLMSGVDAVIAMGFVDEKALYVTGGSGGGVLTAWIVGNTDRFRAAVVAKPVINWASFSLTSDGAPYYSSYWFEKQPWEDPEGYWARSPLSLVGNVTTPTALLTGEADLRTPMSQSEEYYQALQIRGVDTVLIRVPEAYHGIAARPSQLIAKVDNILAWFERYPPGQE